MTALLLLILITPVQLPYCASMLHCSVHGARADFVGEVYEDEDCVCVYQHPLQGGVHVLTRDCE